MAIDVPRVLFENCPRDCSLLFISALIDVFVFRAIVMQVAIVKFQARAFEITSDTHLLLVQFSFLLDFYEV